MKALSAARAADGCARTLSACPFLHERGPRHFAFQFPPKRLPHDLCLAHAAQRSQAFRQTINLSILHIERHVISFE